MMILIDVSRADAMKFTSTNVVQAFLFVLLLLFFIIVIVLYISIFVFVFVQQFCSASILMKIDFLFFLQMIIVQHA